MFAIAVVAIILGYALAYTGAMNLQNGSQGPTLWEALSSNNVGTAHAIGNIITPTAPSVAPPTGGPTFQQL